VDLKCKWVHLATLSYVVCPSVSLSFSSRPAILPYLISTPSSAAMSLFLLLLSLVAFAAGSSDPTCHDAPGEWVCILKKVALWQPMTDYDQWPELLWNESSLFLRASVSNGILVAHNNVHRLSSFWSQISGKSRQSKDQRLTMTNFSSQEYTIMRT
jgi:hypothetical protein